MMAKAVFQEWKVTIGATNIVLIMLLVRPLFFTNTLGLTSEVMDALNYALGTGNSARFVRGMILPLCVALFGILLEFYEKNDGFKDGKLYEYIPAIGIGCLAGFSFLWSNDYGISCFVCFIVMTFWISLSRKRKFKLALLDTTVEIISSLLSLFIFIEIFTLGHFGEWLDSMCGTGNYQSWYYNSDKSYYLYDIDFTYIMLIQAFIAIVYLLFLYQKNGSKTAIIRYGILVLLI